MKVKILALAVGLLAGASAALAGDGFEAPKIEKAIPWAAIGIAAGAVLGIVVLAFKSSRRTHLD